MRTFQQIAAAAQQRQALLVPIRLLCGEDELARRISTPERRAHLKSIDVEASRERSRQACVLDPQHQNTLVLDVTFASPQESAAAIRNHVLNVAGNP